MPFAFEHTYAQLPSRFYARVLPTPVAGPSLLALNAELAALLGLDPDELAAPQGVEVLAGNRRPEGADPIALAYAGHQFGGFVPQLGDGRAILLGELIGRDGRRRDLQLKGAGPTPFSRGGDGRAAVGPVLREYVLSEAMAALGVPTTRALAAVATGQRVYRDRPLPGAVLARVASSHLRVGTFQFFAARDDREGLERLAAYALARHYPDAPAADGAALALVDAVLGAQAALVARWLSIGFVHGVMNTDNCSIAGETLDYGPCAFLDAFDPQRTFSSIDHRGRYAFANQPRIAHWNVTRLAEALLPLVSDDDDAAVKAVTERLDTFPARFDAAYDAELRRKLGLRSVERDDRALADALLAAMADQKADYTRSFRQLAAVAGGAPDAALTELFADAHGVSAWLVRWRERLTREPATAAQRAEEMRATNPAIVPRNHQVEAMIDAAVGGDLEPFRRLHRALSRPFDEPTDAADLTASPGPEQWGYKTFCGT